jgi:hypothetical protein
MMRLMALATVAVLAGAVASAPAIAPSYAQGMSKPAKMSKEERAAAKAANKANKAECGRRADEQKLHLVKRYRFVRKCMKTA